MKINALIVFVLFFIAGQAICSFGGIEWQANTVSKSNNKESTLVIHGYAQKGSVREDFIDSKGDGNTGFKKGDYLIYDTAKNIVYWVDTKEKTYTEMSIDSLAKIAGAAGQIVQMKVSNPKVVVKKLDAAKMLGYNCQHLSIGTSYDMETKIMFLSTKSHLDQTNEIWGSDAVSKQDISAGYEGKYFKTSFPEIDTLLQKEMESYKNIGFILKSVLTQKTTDQDNKTQTMTNEMTVESIASKDLSGDLFKIPAGYKKTESQIPGDSNKTDNKEGDKNKDINADDLLKGLFN